MIIMVGFPGSSDCEGPAYNAGNSGFPISGSGMSPGEGKGYPLQCSCLEISMDRGASRVTVAKSGTKSGVAKSGTRLSD